MEPQNAAERDLVQDLVAKTNGVLLYEDFSLQNLALEKIPIETLSANASAKAASLMSGSKEKIGEDDLLILELLQWFKFSFFSWVDVPKCESCGADTERTGMTAPSQEEQIWGAQRVESYFCSQCQRQIRFPRYNHPKKLLETRKGRCGEWANCFTFLCRSLGYDARLVFEWGDHVWTEVYSLSQKRWLHCDPCENACDKPLMYEIGWRKKISYVIAISKDEVQDVTWRYCTNFQEVLHRRVLYREEFLLHVLTSITRSLQRNLSSERREQLLKQKLKELVSFLTPPTVAEEFEGRSSGSQAWREARGEFHPEKQRQCHIFSLNDDEISRKCFHLKYSCAMDKYIRVSSSSSETSEWEVLTFDRNNVFRKIERDWNMAYIARKEGCSEGHVSWKFDFNRSGLVIESLKLNIACKTFENGVVTWVVNSGKLAIPVNADFCPVTIKDLQGSSEFSLTAQLTGGKGPVAWQHAQLFRQPLNSQEYPFEIEVHFMQKPEGLCS